MQTWRDSNFIILNFSQRLKIISELKRFSFYLEKLQYPEFDSNLKYKLCEILPFNDQI